MINKVNLNNKNNNITPIKIINKPAQPAFTGLGDFVVQGMVQGIQKCEQYPMLNVTVLDCLTAIFPRTFFETFIGSKQQDENGQPKKRKLNIFGGFEAFRRESSGLFINCIIPSFVVIGVAKLLNRPVMGNFKHSNLTGSWANSETINLVEKYYNNAIEGSHEVKTYNTLKNLFLDLEGVNGHSITKFRDVLENDENFDKLLKKAAKSFTSDKERKNYASLLYKYIVKHTHVAENIKIGSENKFLTSSLGHVCDSAHDMLHGIYKENILDKAKVSQYFNKSKMLVNLKSGVGLLGIIIPLALSAQPINRWITHKLSGRKGAPLYNDDKERILTPEEQRKLTAQKFFAVPLMMGVAGLSMFMDRPSLKMFQFKGIFPTMDQARLISAATFSSRIAAAEDSNELQENTIRDIATFSSFYFLGDYAAKAIATFIQKTNKNITLINRLKTTQKDANIFAKFWNWAKHTKIKSSDELNAISDKSLRIKSKNLRGLCQLGNLAFSLISLGVFIPLYTRTQAQKKKQVAEQIANEKKAKAREIENKVNQPTFQSFLQGKNKAA